MRNFRLLLCIFFVAGLFSSCGNSSSSEIMADLVLNNAQVYTVNRDQPNAEAVAIKNGKIIFIGSNADAQKYASEKTELFDCKGQFVMPGFIEGHGHIHGLGASLMSLNLMQAKNWEDILAMVADVTKKAKPGDWIVGRGWHQEKWDKAPKKNYLGYPYYQELDKISINNPVILIHASGHSVFVNSKAMELAGITVSTPNPKGGDIVKDKNGTIVGVLEETAQQLASKAYGEWLALQTEASRKAQWIESMRLAEEDCLKKGITSFQDAGSSFQQVQWMKELAQQNKFKIRHWAMVREGNARLQKNKNVFPITGEGGGYLTVKSVKVSLDGALGSYGAWLLEPYSDRTGWMGQNTFNIDSLKAIAEFCWTNNLQLCVHAIGDRANRETINLFSEQIKKDKNKDHRWRVEHAQHVNPVEIPRFKEWNVIASMQSIHCTSDAPFVSKRLGDKRAAEGAYMWKAFLNAGVVVTNGTDVPVEDVDPFNCYYAAVTRKTKNGEAFYPAQSMTREEALYSYTMANAFAAFEENEKGSLEVGKNADIILLSNNLLTCKEEDIRNTKVIVTIVGGKVQYKK